MLNLVKMMKESCDLTLENTCFENFLYKACSFVFKNLPKIDKKLFLFTEKLLLFEMAEIKPFKPSNL